MYVRLYVCACIQEKERARKDKKTQLQLPLSASNAKHICNRNFFVAMYLPTNDDLLLHIFVSILY